MGDRTSVTLTVLRSQFGIVRDLLPFPASEEWEAVDSQYQFRFHEVNCGELDFLPELRDNGIAFDSEWDAGSEYGAGGKYGRFSSTGEYIEKELYDSDSNPPLHALLEHISEPEKLRQYILDFAEKVAVLPWENQEASGKLYLARRLIAPE